LLGVLIGFLLLYPEHEIIMPNKCDKL